VTDGTLALDEPASERNSGQILPAILFLFAHKREFADSNAAASPVLRPAVACGQVRLLRQGFATQLGNGEMRHVRPFFDGAEGFGV